MNNKAIKWYRSLKYGDKIGNQRINKSNSIDNQEALETYMEQEINELPFKNIWSFSSWESGENLLIKLVEIYGSNGVIQMFDNYKPIRPLKKDENLITLETKSAPKCCNKKCSISPINNAISKKDGYCNFAYEISGCLTNTCVDLLITFIIGGWSAIKEEKENSQLHEEIFNYIEKHWDKNYIGIEEINLYGIDVINKSNNCKITHEDDEYLSIEIFKLNSLNYNNNVIEINNIIKLKPENIAEIKIRKVINNESNR